MMVQFTIFVQYAKTASMVQIKIFVKFSKNISKKGKICGLNYWENISVK